MNMNACRDMSSNEPIHLTEVFLTEFEPWERGKHSFISFLNLYGHKLTESKYKITNLSGSGNEACSRSLSTGEEQEEPKVRAIRPKSISQRRRRTSPTWWTRLWGCSWGARSWRGYSRPGMFWLPVRKTTICEPKHTDPIPWYSLWATRRLVPSTT